MKIDTYYTAVYNNQGDHTYCLVKNLLHLCTGNLNTFWLVEATRMPCKKKRITIIVFENEQHLMHPSLKCTLNSDHKISIIRDAV